MKLSIIIPVYNEEKTIIEILNRVKNVELKGASKEIIVVDDGSTDKTSQVISQLKKIEGKNIIFISHPKNQGKGAAIKTGIGYATGDYIAIQDADLEYNPQDLIRLIEPINKGMSQVVYGTRLKRLPNFSKEERKLRFVIHYAGNKFLSFITSILYGQWITDMETGYKLFSRKSLGELHLKSRGFDFEPEITSKLLKNGYKILEVPISTNPRGYNEGKKLNTLKDGTIALFTLLKFRFID